MFYIGACLKMVKLVERITKRGDNRSASYSITIPLALVKKMKWKKGDEILITPLDEVCLKIEKLDI